MIRQILATEHTRACLLAFCVLKMVPVRVSRCVLNSILYHAFLATTCVLFATAALKEQQQGSCDADGGCDSNTSTSTTGREVRRVQWDSVIMSDEFVELLAAG